MPAVPRGDGSPPARCQAERRRDDGDKGKRSAKKKAPEAVKPQVPPKRRDRRLAESDR